MDVFPKQPGDTDVFVADFTDWLAERGDTISSILGITADTGLTVGVSSIVGTTVEVLLSGGTTGTRYNVRTRIQTAGDLIKEHDFVVAVREKGRAS